MRSESPDQIEDRSGNFGSVRFSDTPRRYSIASTSSNSRTPRPHRRENSVWTVLSRSSILLQSLPTTPDVTDYKIIVVHFILGCTGLVPSSLLVTVFPFLQSRVLGSPFSNTFGSYLFIAQNLAGFITLGHATVISKSVSPTRQTRLTIYALLFLTFLTMLSALIRTTPNTFFIFIMLIAISSAAFVSYFQSAVFAVASIFGPRAVQAVMAGQAAIGVVVTLVQLLSVAESIHLNRPALGNLAQVKRTPEELSAFACFAFATCLLGVSLVAHAWLVRHREYKTLIVPIEMRVLAEEEEGERQSLLNPASSRRISRVSISSFLLETSSERIKRVARMNITYELAIAYVFVVTLSVFPPITTAIKPVNAWFNPLLFNALHVLLFNLGDLFGRFLCTFPAIFISNPNSLLSLAFSHTIFIPLFIACNVQQPSAPTTGLLHFLFPSSPGSPPLINSDLLFFLILFAFGTSNGYISTLCLMSAPSFEHNKRMRDPEDVDTAVTICLFCMMCGLTLGSFASFAIRSIVYKCNPFVPR